MGGRVAEKLIYDNVSTGAADDIEKASQLMFNYTSKWGMNKTIGPLNPEVMGNIGKNLDKEIFKECKTIINTLEKFVYATLRHHKDEVIAIAKSLLENETINYEKIKQIVPDKLENSMCVQDLF